MSFEFSYIVLNIHSFCYLLGKQLVLLLGTLYAVRVQSASVCNSDTLYTTVYNCTNCGQNRQGFADSILFRWSNAQVFARHATSFTESTKVECAQQPGNKYNFNNRLAGSCAWNNMPSSLNSPITVASFVHTSIDPYNRVIFATMPSTRTIWMMSTERGNTSTFRVTGGNDMGPFDSDGAWIDGPRNVADFKRLGGLLYSARAECLLVWDVDRIRRVDLSSDNWGMVSLLCGVVQRYELLSLQHKLNIEAKYFDFKRYRTGQPGQAGGLCDIDSTQILPETMIENNSLYNHLYEFLRRYAFFYNTNQQWKWGQGEVSGFAENGDGKIYFMLNYQPHVWRLVNYPGIGNGWIAGVIMGSVPCYNDRYNKWPIYPWPTVDDKLWDLYAVETRIQSGWSNERCYDYDSVLICSCNQQSPGLYPDKSGTVFTVANDLMFLVSQGYLVSVNLKHPSLEYGKVNVHYNNLPWWDFRLIAVFQNNLAVVIPNENKELYMYEYEVNYNSKSIQFKRSYAWTLLLNQQPLSMPLPVVLDKSYDKWPIYPITAMIGAEDFLYFVQNSTTKGTSQIFRVKLSGCWHCEQNIFVDFSGIKSACDALHGFFQYSWADSNPYLGSGSFTKPSWGTFCCSAATCSDNIFTSCDTASPAIPCFFESFYAIESKEDCACTQAACFPTSCMDGQEQSIPFKPLSCVWCPAGKYSNVTDIDFIRVNGAKCRTCPVGKYSTERSNVCVDCDMGKYNDSPGLSKCFDCVAPLVRETSTSGPCHECPLGSLYVNNNTACFFCPPGKYSDNRVSCETCLQITYSDEYGLSKCKLCQGSYGTAGSESTEDRTQCRRCAPGKYNPSWGYPHPGGDLYGDGSYVPPHLNSGCQFCPAAYQASASQSRCVFCPEGKVNPYDNVGICKSCNWNETHDTRRESCIPCENGVNRNYMQDVMNYSVYSIDEASTMPLTNSVYEVPYQNTGIPSGCVQCRAGYEARKTDTGVECLPCAIGKYHPPPVTRVGEFMHEYSNVYKCESCPAHEYNNEIGGIICWECGWQMFRDLTAPVQDQTSCIKCPKGKYYLSYYSLDPNTHLGGIEKCTSCSAGTYAPYQAQCELCPVGKYSSYAESFACNKCQNGKVALGTGKTACTLCDGSPDMDLLTSTLIPSADAAACVGCPKGMASWFQNSSSSLSFGCSLCPAGKYAPLESNQKCFLCPEGKYSPMPGLKECWLCPAGSVSAIGQTLCEKCPIGKYSNDKTNNLCLNCPENSISFNAGSSECLCNHGYAYTLHGCTQCRSPYFKATYDNISCIKCELPAMWIDSATCACGIGHYIFVTETRYNCVKCPAHKTTLVTNAKSKDACVCDLGYYQSGYNDNCNSCPRGSTTLEIGSSNISQCIACKDSRMILKSSFINYDLECGGADYSPCVCPQGFVRKGDVCLECILCACGTNAPEIDNVRGITGDAVQSTSYVPYALQFSFLLFHLIDCVFFPPCL